MSTSTLSANYFLIPTSKHEKLDGLNATTMGCWPIKKYYLLFIMDPFGHHNILWRFTSPDAKPVLDW
jgi:hypothetical protein